MEDGATPRILGTMHVQVCDEAEHRSVAEALFVEISVCQQGTISNPIAELQRTYIV
jgi:hypothetical protein